MISIEDLWFSYCGRIVMTTSGRGTLVSGWKGILKILSRCLIDFLIGLGAVELYFGNFKFEQIYSGWYPFFPLFSLGLDPNYSPWLQNVTKFCNETFHREFLLRCLAQIFSKFYINLIVALNVNRIPISTFKTIWRLFLMLSHTHAFKFSWIFYVSKSFSFLEKI